MSEELQTTTTETSSNTAASSTPVQQSSGATPVVPATTGKGEGATQVAAATEATAPAYTPNYKYKFNDQELEFDEWARPLVNKDNEEKLRDLYQRAKYVDETKPKYNQLRDEHGKLNTKWETALKNIQQLDYYTEQGDFEAFFKKLGIDEQKIYKWVLDKVEYQKLPPEQRAAYDAKNAHARRIYELEQENQRLASLQDQSTVQAKALQVEMMIQVPEVKVVADALDSALGRKGAFRDEVIRRGIAVSHTTGEDISTERAISETLAVYAPLIKAGQLSSTGASANSSVHANPPVIPHVSGKNISPVKKLPRSTDDLRKIEKAME